MTDQKPTEASPRPWEGGSCNIRDADGKSIVLVAGEKTTILEDKANARLIVTAVNNHDALVSALERAEQAFDHLWAAIGDRLHKGQEIEDLPSDYLQWLAENVTGKDWLVREAEEQLKMREGQGRVTRRSE